MLWRRIKNLWVLSGYELPPLDGQESSKLSGTQTIRNLFKKERLAKIIDTEDNIKKIFS